MSKKNGLYETNRIVNIPAEDIMPNPAQPRKRFDSAALSELSESIRRYGILQPLVVRRKGKVYELVAGERRLKAARMAGMNYVPCVILDVDTVDSSALALIENIHRCNLDFIEEAEAIYFLVTAYGLSQEDVAKKIGKSQSSVANKLRILKLPGELLYIIREQGLTERHARALLRIPENEKRVAVLEQIIKQNMNVAKTEEYIDSVLNEGEKCLKQKKTTAKPVYVLKDVRLFLNTISRGMNIMKRSGIEASCGQRETDTDIVVTITIPKESK